MPKNTDLQNASEVAIVGLAMLDNSHAFNELVRRRQSIVRNFMYRLSGDRTLADDLSQQVFLQAWRTIKSLQSVAAYPAWLKKVSVNVWLQHCRKSQLPIDQQGDAEAEADLTGNNPAQAIDLDAALQMLPASARLCLVLAYQDGMSHREIAELAKLPLGTVKSHITRGGKRLRALLVDYRS